jgi:hypothetical protein
MRDRDTIDLELRLVAGLRRTAGPLAEPTPAEATNSPASRPLLDDLLDDLLDELLEERHGSGAQPWVDADCSDLGPLCW